MKKYNIFITFEGGDGAGKSTVANLVSKKLQELSIKTLITREPGGKDLRFSEDIRKIIMNNPKIDLLTELLLFQASRKEHISKVIAPALDNGYLVISDRYIDSSTVYQGAVKGIPIKVVDKINNLVVQKFIPDLTIIFDIDPKLSLKRINNTSRKKNRFDHQTLNFHIKVRKEFLKLAKKNKKRCVIIDASKPLNQVVNDVLNLIVDKINL